MAGKRVTKLNNQFTRDQENHQARQREYRKKVHLRRVIVIGSVFLVLALVLGIQLWSAHRQLTKLDNQISAAQTTLKQKKAKNKKLAKQKKLLEDPAYLQELIRAKYNYAKKGEIIYNFVK